MKKAMETIQVPIKYFMFSCQTIGISEEHT